MSGMRARVISDRGIFHFNISREQMHWNGLKSGEVYEECIMISERLLFVDLLIVRVRLLIHV